jgi:hypothetical protein
METMAEIEHGRWNAERLAAGWRYGRERDHDRKISPYLVSWTDLPPEIKQYDRDFITGLPAVLASAGLEVYRLTGSIRPKKDRKTKRGRS